MPVCFATCTASCSSDHDAVGQCGSLPTRCIAVESAGTALSATIRSPSAWLICRPPQVPTRISFLQPSWISSSKTIVAPGQPMPVPCTDTGLPFQVPVKPSRSRSVFRGTGESKYVSAMYLARSGSPGRRTASA